MLPALLCSADVHRLLLCFASAAIATPRPGGPSGSASAAARGSWWALASLGHGSVSLFEASSSDGDAAASVAAESSDDNRQRQPQRAGGAAGADRAGGGDASGAAGAAAGEDEAALILRERPLPEFHRGAVRCMTALLPAAGPDGLGAGLLGAVRGMCCAPPAAASIVGGVGGAGACSGESGGVRAG